MAALGVYGLDEDSVIEGRVKRQLVRDSSDFTNTLIPRFASLIGPEEMQLKPKRCTIFHTFVLIFI